MGQLCHCDPWCRIEAVEERQRGKEKSPQGYDEDNASLDKFGKIKGKKTGT